MARQQKLEQWSKEQMEKTAQFIEKTKNILVVTEPEPVRKGDGGRRGKVGQIWFQLFIKQMLFGTSLFIHDYFDLH